MLKVKDDEVYLAMCDRVKQSPDKFLHGDPYHRYIRILNTLDDKKLISQGITCVDLGCLRPELASLLINNFDAKVTGIDQWDMLNYWPNIKMKYHNADLSKDFTEVLTEKYDIVFALEILEHMIDTDVFLERIKSSLKKGGLVVISTPNINSFRNRVTVPFGIYPSYMEYKNHIHHVRLYNMPKLESHLKEHGFTLLCKLGINLLPYRGPMNFVPYRKLSEALGDMFPQLCSNIVAIARVD